MEREIAFDKEGYRVINEARGQYLRECISQIPFRDELSTALDVGCGAGYFSRVLRELGFSVTGLDLRDENIEVCRERYRDINFGLINLDDDFGDIGSFDLVLMFGILYHLQSPLQAIDRLSKTIGRIGFISTRAAPGEQMAMYLFEEQEGEAHNNVRTTAVPTFPAIVSIFRSAGFEFIYLPRKQPDHPQWAPQYGNGRRRSFIVSREAIDVPDWERLEPAKFLVKWKPID